MLDNALLNLTHEQQQQAVEQIQQLMAQGVACGEAIKIVAARLREEHANGCHDNHALEPQK